jgi:hypothetical protein
MAITPPELAALQRNAHGALEADFAQVRVHQGESATRDVGAMAYAAGSNISIGAGSSGVDLSAHELTHVVQQGAAARAWERPR